MSRVRPIASRSNPQWQQLRRLAQQPSAYRQQRRIWLEGEHLCDEAVKRGQPIELAVIAESAWSEPRLRGLAESAPDILLMPDALLGSISTMDSAPPLALVLPWRDGGPIEPSVPSVVLDRLQDAGNVGTILRSAAAFGFRQVLALEGQRRACGRRRCCARAWGRTSHCGWSNRCSRATSPCSSCRCSRRARTPTRRSTRSALPWPCAWALGHEGQGLSGEVAQRCAAALRIAQPGGLESLNVAAAASICLYESSRQRALRAG